MLKYDVPILLVDDEEDILFSYNFALKSAGYKNITAASGGKKAMEILGQRAFALVVLDLYMPEVDGNDILDFISIRHPGTPVIIITAADDSQTAVNCLKKGADDYILKPVDSLRFITTIKNILEKEELKRQVESFAEAAEASHLKCPVDFGSIVTKESSMYAVFKYIEAVAGGMQPVLICGETGTGKELMAEAVHKASKRKGAFVPVNVADVDDTVFSDTLFGHRKGAFTGADKVRRGLLLEASGGTIFLDEVGDISENSQIKLLRFIQEGTFRAMGSDTEDKADVRIVLATNADLEKKVEDGRFRKDLYYRIATHKIHMPPLRDRKGDIPLLFAHFYKLAGKELGTPAKTFEKTAAGVLSSYTFPGNIRELRSIAYDLAAISGDMLTAGEVIAYLESTGRSRGAVSTVSPGGTQFTYSGKFPSLKDMEDILISEALKISGGNQSKAAALLGISRQAMNKRVKG
ncbi:sigma-54-dependent transcriptional regulator [Geovibrio thiophilus]|nr:sigma-54 dependent transcriptional regulator [Geovibrio thiophilus]